LDYQRINQSVNAQLASAYQAYRTNLSLVSLEENNQRIAAQNLDITLTRYRLGTITQIEIRDAQLNYLNATVRLNNARYQAKLAEVSLREISGNINL
ncbi:MAG TPA: TolC family protein, partial [Pedobacter sp.]